MPPKVEQFSLPKYPETYGKEVQMTGMEDLARILTTKIEDRSEAPFGLLEYNVSCIGGLSILSQVASHLPRCVGRGEKCMLLLVGQQRFAHLAGSPAGDRPQLQHLPTAELLNGDGLPRAVCQAVTSAAGSLGEGGRVCLVLEALSSLILWHSLALVLEMLQEVRSMAPLSCVLGLLHTDLHSSQTAFALERAAKSLMRVEAVWEGLKSKGLPQPQRVDGSLVLQDKRRTGRVQCKRQWYQVQADGHIATVDTLEDPDLKPKLPGRDIGAKASQDGGKPAPQPGMRIDLSPQELLARGSVALPYEKIRNLELDGASGSVEIRERGPSARESRQGGLGQIMYVRDSESDHDSDEDPDDDLDF